MKYMIIGTAGHVDHGKSAIIKALTGTDTDRLKEEKLRGISIDLGFASLNLGDDMIAGIVDVPGHERFLKNMLAGSGGIDLVMLVIAADEGIMPQTREHLAMLQLLGIRQGVVVINKIDKVDEEWLELIESETRGFLAGTFLEAAKYIHVSAITGAGLDTLKNTLAQLAKTVPARNGSAPFRLWIDRVFTVKGYGVVVTGSVLSGSAKSGDTMILYPAGKLVRVRGFESHGRKTEVIYAGQRAAINISGVDMEEIFRGMALSSPERGEISNLWDITVEWLQEVASGTRVRLHLGTGEFLGRVYQYKDTSNKYMRLILEAPLAASLGDKGILRLYSPQYLLGGATLLAPGKASRKFGPELAELEQAIAAGNTEGMIWGRLAGAHKIQGVEDIRRQAGYLTDITVAAAVAGLEKDEKLVNLKEGYIARPVLEQMTKQMLAVLKEYHRSQPDRGGMGKDILRQKLKLDEKTFERLLEYWHAHSGIIMTGGDIALAAHAAKHGDWKQDLTAKAEAALAGIGLTDIDILLLGEKLALPFEKAKAAHEILTRAGILIKVGDMFVYRKTIQYIAQLIQKHFQVYSTLSVAELRDMLNTSRKVAVPLMEYFDMHKYTIRDGDLRHATRKILDLSE
ncbi:MAG TPA: selenocysteine-specific translation elongation factor [Methylomusa anaerophila]|uniref:Selenocysteine-specific elongation factor n=1 Tax=Methylomusa anaerophila TaxID=1930071 RepID=A0A348AHP7_9FIRM|nr:selenocysteine-specific translation elongation factor [Methylomusa anaerophila]BBB90595.1 selenocysteine-specific elongation factor [Methylomusa anaerophila]HML88798.1 selenocysteine-specific translation elongation factor [Methylomusa anaerophila]